MTTEVRASAPELTYEGIADYIISLLMQAGAITPEAEPTPWDAFLRLSNLVHETFEIPSSTFTPIMRRLLFAIGFAARPTYMVGVGTYVGYTFSWLLRDRSDSETSPFFEQAVGIDLDPAANALAKCNCAALGHGQRLLFLDGDGANTIAGFRQSINLLYLDLDDPVAGKAAYQSVLRAALPHLQPNALVLAHDACVKTFAQDFKAYHEFVRDSGLFSGVWVFPVDDCGLSVVVKR